VAKVAEFLSTSMLLIAGWTGRQLQNENSHTKMLRVAAGWRLMLNCW
jgi:hypothetical protein